MVDGALATQVDLLERNGVGFRFFTGPLDELIRWLYHQRGIGHSVTISVCNVHLFVESMRDPALGHAISSSTLCICDGQPVVWLIRLLKGHSIPRVTGPDLFSEILLNHLGSLRVALVGGTSELLERVRTRTKEDHASNLLTIDPGVVSADGAVHSTIIDNLRAFRPDIVFVGLGCPKQEKWICNACTQMPAIYCGVGAAFAYFTGGLKRAHPIIGRLGLEWIFRLWQQPILIGRYMRTNFPFLLILFEALINSKGHSR